ncbi:MAG TPA: hypothetical protein VFU47_04870, partial [Armatimonadota bacterium]|nr:hypothetical protein [Armatimonadota bacterium]
YLVQVTSQTNRFGGDVFYRLQIAPPPTQDFKLTVTPDEINLGPGGSVALTVNVQRIAGYGAAIPLKMEGLPAGVTASYSTIPAGQNSASFTLTADPNAAAGALGMLKIIGTGTLNGQEVQREAQPIEIYRQPLAAENQNSERDILLFPVTVMNPQPFALDIEPRQVTVKKGQSVEIKIKAIRQMGQNAQIAIAVAGQPANVTPAAQPIAANQNEVVLKITAAGNAPVVTQNLIITGTMNNVAHVAPALTLTITD